MNRKRNRKAFTVVELVIVIAVIAVLATVLVPTFGDVIQNAKDSAAEQEAKNAYTSYMVENAAKGEMPELFLFQADEDRVVAIQNGAAVGVYENEEAALIDLIGEGYDETKLQATANDKLYAYGGEVPVQGAPEVSEPTWDTDSDGTLSILAIGNSFSVDALEYFYQIATNLGVENVVIGNLYIGSCSLSMHANNAENDHAVYHYFYNDSGSWNKSTASYPNGNGDTSINTALTERSWDYVSLQQVSSYSGREETYNNDLDNLIRYVKANSLNENVKLVWHMTWAYQQNATHSAFPTYNSDQSTMYNAIVSAVQSKIASNSDIDIIIPSGTAVQNSRTSLLGDTTTKDGYHMTNDYGRYLAGLMFVRSITGLPVDDISYAPNGVTNSQKAIAIAAVNAAYETPFFISDLAYTGYTRLDLNLNKSAYWFNMNENPNGNDSIVDLNNYSGQISPVYFWCTRMFTKEELPNGTVILLSSGWQYRAEWWNANLDPVATKNDRGKTTTASKTTVNDTWWGTMYYRGFNIYINTNTNISGRTESDINEVFRIYVPIF